MPSIDMIFSLHLKPSGPGFKVIATSPDGRTSEELMDQPSKKFKQDLPHVQEVLQKRSETDRSRRPNGILKRLDIASDRLTVREMGTEVFSLLFAGSVGALYEESKRHAAQSNAFLRITLVIDAPAVKATHAQLAALPWEMAFDTSLRQHVCLSSATSFSRGLNANVVFRNRQSPVRILCMAATPQQIGDFQFDRIDADGEAAEIGARFREAEEKGRVTVDFTRSATKAELKRRLWERRTSGGWSVFHFIGHGGYDGADGQGIIYLQESGGTDAVPIDATTLAQMLVVPNATPQLVVLNSCEGAFAPAGLSFSSTAETLVRTGVPAVVAMQFTVTEKAAQLFTGSFYDALSRGVTIQDAMGQARQELSMAGICEWVTPALYMSCPDFALVDPVPESVPGPAGAGP